MTLNALLGETGRQVTREEAARVQQVHPGRLGCGLLREEATCSTIDTSLSAAG
jgi:hypothetical protein